MKSKTVFALLAGVVTGAFIAALSGSLPKRSLPAAAPAKRDNAEELDVWMGASMTAFKATTNDAGRIEYDVSLWDMNAVYPTLTVRLYAEENHIVSRCEFPVFVREACCERIVRLFDGCMEKASAFKYGLDQSNGRAWCECTTPFGMCGDPTHCDGCRRSFANLAIYRVAREVGSSAPEVAKIVGMDGEGDPKIERLRKAVAAGDAQACADLGEAYDRGLGVAFDRRKAVAFYRQGAARNNAAAIVGLADAYQRGDVIEKNEAEAKKLLRRAARMGNIVARIWVADTEDDQDNTEEL